jgi:hypothetical protein
MAWSPVPPLVFMIFCGLRGLTLVELLRLLVLRECWTPCTILVFRWCPYETEGFLSTSILCFGRDCEEGVTPRGEALRVLAALAARPRVRDGSREAGGGKGAVFGAINRGSGGGLVPVRSGVAIDGEEAWPRPSEDSSRGAMGRTGQQVSQCSLILPHRKLQQLHVHAQHHAALGPRSPAIDIDIPIFSQRRSQARSS